MSRRLPGRPRFRDAVRGLLRQQLLDATSQIVAADGWGAVTMAKLAQRVGVSRQTVYNEVGSKPELAQALILRELDRFLTAVVAQVQGHDDVVDGLRAASLGALDVGHDNPVLKAVLSSAHGGDSDLLPFLTTHSEALLARAGAVVATVVRERHGGDLGLSDDRLDAMVDTVVRLVLSHVMQPMKAPEQIADDIAWVVRGVLGRRDVTRGA